MEQTKLYNALDGLFAYDTGATDSGIKDEPLRTDVKAYLFTLDDVEFRLVMSRFIRDTFLSEESLQGGRGIEDVVDFIKWLDNEMDITL